MIVCTNRPSLSIKIEISRNIVSVSEDVLRLNTTDFTYIYSFYYFTNNNFNYFYTKFK